jgi:hypothetical protein
MREGTPAPRGAITKAGPEAIRIALVEAAWACRRKPAIGATLRRWQAGLPAHHAGPLLEGPRGSAGQPDAGWSRAYPRHRRPTWPDTSSHPAPRSRGSSKRPLAAKSAMPGNG